ncbi:unnamed protein product [Rotaria socialis]|uniref:G-protein coupled receptors family 1 profile domain-containing protein n=2 Tax=Rotaria socialis TaxID=392032 RepID=A0A821AQ22_9BILA|nr:unnamed protein product [Rotaria socialis]CAF3427137.1 unnamed protein product [Rotaria socialis]CAF3539988.1 unnamed protein product [Rotaria socialis]CAF4298020.1 unnamed protein product [Rotaria socialis]CAF4374675.1 unnamed protein product [Rotaria socialis]
MELNETTLSMTIMNDESFNRNIRLTNLTLSSAGIVCNFILLIILLILDRHQCTTYFLLILMTICDFLYCTVYASILLTIENYFNIINHQILCPLSFFLTPFTFTGSTLLLFICLLHLITNYKRKYNTILGQIGGRLSVVFVFAFIIIRSVLGSTSIELMSDSIMPQIQHCTIDMNTPEIVTKVQNIVHIFAEVTDILVYIGWIAILFIYFMSLIKNKILKKQNGINQKSDRFVSFLSVRRKQEGNLNSTNEQRLTNKERHNNVSLIILLISLLSILFYLPVMINKFITMTLIYQGKTFLNDQQIYYLQVIQQTTHLFCLTIRFIPYGLFDKRIRSSIHHLIGMKIQKIKLTKKTKYQQTYICHCQCSRRQQSLELNTI